jgi:hypothetical protein
MSEVSSPSQNNVYTIRQQNLASKVVRRVYISTLINIRENGSAILPLLGVNLLVY